MILTTGMSIFGNMSVGVVWIAKRPKQQDENSQHNKRVGPVKGKPDNPHNLSLKTARGEAAAIADALTDVRFDVEDSASHELLCRFAHRSLITMSRHCVLSRLTPTISNQSRNNITRSNALSIPLPVAGPNTTNVVWQLLESARSHSHEMHAVRRRLRVN